MIYLRDICNDSYFKDNFLEVYRCFVFLKSTLGLWIHRKDRIYNPNSSCLLWKSNF